MSLVEIGEFLVNPAHVMYVKLARNIMDEEPRPLSPYLVMVDGTTLRISLPFSEIHDLLDPKLKWFPNERNDTDDSMGTYKRVPR